MLDSAQRVASASLAEGVLSSEQTRIRWCVFCVRIPELGAPLGNTLLQGECSLYGGLRTGRDLDLEISGST